MLDKTKIAHDLLAIHTCICVNTLPYCLGLLHILLLGASVGEHQMVEVKWVVQLLDHDDHVAVKSEHENLVVVQLEAETRQIVLDQGSNSNLFGMELQIDTHLHYMECYSTDVND